MLPKKYSMFASATMLVTLFACNINSKPEIPDFSFRLSDSTTIMKTGDIPKGTPIVLIHFEADCSGCQRLTDSLLLKMDTFQDVQFYFLTSEQFSMVTLFNDHYKLTRFKNITVGQDYAGAISRAFRNPSTPLIALYDINQRLSALYDGRPSSAELYSAIENIK